MIVEYSADVRVFLTGNLYGKSDLSEVTLRIVERDVDFTVNCLMTKG